MRLLLGVFLLTTFVIHSQKLEDMTIKEEQFVYDQTISLRAGARLNIGILVKAYKKKPTKVKEFRTPYGYFGGKGNIGWGEFIVEVEGGKFIKPKGQILVDEDPSVDKLVIKITNRFNSNFLINRTIPFDHGGEQKFVFEGEQGYTGRRGGNAGRYNVGERDNNISLYHGEDGGTGGKGQKGDSLEIFVTLKQDPELGDMVHVHLINLTKGKEYKRKFNPDNAGEITVISKGGKGGDGGRGGNGKRSGSTLGRGGDGGNGGNGGDGGVIIMYVDVKAEKYKNRITLRSEGGDPGQHGMPGTPGSYVNNQNQRVYGKRGGMGLNGNKGNPGPDPIIKVIPIEKE